MIFDRVLLSVATGLILSGAAHADGWYVSGAIGTNIQSDSSNSGATGAFTTGNLGDGTTLDVAAGTAYGWETEFDNGTSFSAEVGRTYYNTGGYRAGVELVVSNADVDTHTDVSLGGGAIGALDAAAIAGSADPLGVTVADVVADGRGEISQTALFVNGYYDFNHTGTFRPYVGAGVGFADVEVTYTPSGIGVIDDSETKLAYQVKAGATYAINESWEVFGEYAYRATEDIETNNDLFPGALDV